MRKSVIPEDQTWSSLNASIVSNPNGVKDKLAYAKMAEVKRDYMYSGPSIIVRSPMSEVRLRDNSQKP